MVGMKPNDILKEQEESREKQRADYQAFLDSRTICRCTRPVLLRSYLNKKLCVCGRLR